MFNTTLKIKITIAIIFIFSAFQTVHAQAELPPIQLDRPDQTECSYLVPAKHFQFESGFNFEEVETGTHNLLYPTLLSKYGVNNRFELRLITELASTRTFSDDFTGLKPIRVGFKAKLLEEKGIQPMTSIIAHLIAPFTASKDFRPKYFAPTFRFTMQHTLSKKVNLAYNLGAEWNGESAEPSFIYTLTTGYAITEKLGAYAELYGFAPQYNDADHRCDGGFTYLLKHNVMLDISGGVGLSEISPDYYISLGFSFRVPK
jgi:hypothetical protein